MEEMTSDPTNYTEIEHNWLSQMWKNTAEMRKNRVKLEESQKMVRNTVSHLNGTKWPTN